MASRGEVASQSGEGYRNVTRSSFVLLPDCGTIFPTSFQSRKGGDMACVRGPLGAFCFIYNMVFFNLESAYSADSCLLPKSACRRWLEVLLNDSLPVSRDTPAVIVSWPKLCFRLTLSRSEPIAQTIIHLDAPWKNAGS
jgi:hypothetical protein